MLARRCPVDLSLGSRHGRVLFAVQFLDAFAVSVTITHLTSYARTFATSMSIASVIGLVSSLYGFSQLIAAPVVGRLGDPKSKSKPKSKMGVSNFKHTGGYSKAIDEDGTFDVKKLPKEYRNILKKAGVKKKEARELTGVLLAIEQRQRRTEGTPSCDWRETRG